jgi:nitrogen fixation/metabolism regulation signal transduction histidine kinase
MPANRTFVRKHFFINRRLQGRYMMTFLIPMLILLAFMLFTLYFAAQTIVNTTTATIKENIEERVTGQFQDVANPSIAQYDAALTGINSYIRNFSSDEKYRRALMGSLLWVFGVGIFLVMIQIALLTVFFSHKLAGPVYRFERACHSLLEGDYIQRIVLRRGDDLQNLADLFNRAIEVTRDRLLALQQATADEDRTRIAEKLKLKE